MEEAQTAREMPKYKCHKTVHALKIKEILQNESPAPTQLLPVEEGYGPVDLPIGFANRHNPEVGGYYVVYDDGYVSHSPAKAFEEGYVSLEPHAHRERVIQEHAELKEKRDKLHAFMTASAAFNKLPSEEKARLQRQLAVMNGYHDVLQERIENFPS